METISVKKNMQTIAFYNLENLFDIEDDEYTNDDDFLPNTAKNWTQKRFNNKVRKLGFSISSIGFYETGKLPAIVGLAEVENDKVIQDLIDSKHLKDTNYNFIHYNSLDERGIDVALIYNEDYFKVLHSETFTVSFKEEDGSLDYTRDILLVTGLLDEEEIHVIVNHWSSRREGQKETEEKRLISSQKVSKLIANLKLNNDDAKIIVMGDFNDEPNNESVKQLVENHNLYNPFETLKSFTRGSVKHNRQWFVFDQIFFSTNFFRRSKNKFEFFKANIFDEEFLKLYKGKYKGSPFRTYVGTKYKGGYSDHFPVYSIFKK